MTLAAKTLSVLGPVGFAILVWGTVALVCVLFGYLVYALARDAGLVG